MSLRIGLAGLGIHGGRYAQHLLAGDVSGARLTAVYRRDAEAGRAFAATHGLEFLPELPALVESARVDAVVAVLPPTEHPKAARLALLADKPVLVEKPLAPDPISGRELLELEAGRSGFLMVGQTLRFDPLIRKMRALQDSIGSLQMISINQRFEPADRSWLDLPGSGGLLLNTGIHGFDLIRYFSDAEVESIQAVTRSEVTRRTEDQVISLMRLSDGRLAVLDNARSTRSRSGRIELIGADGQLWGDHIHRELVRVRGRERETLGPIPAEPTVQQALQAFVDSVASGERPPIDAATGLAAVRCVAAAQQAATTGRIVHLEELS